MLSRSMHRVVHEAAEVAKAYWWNGVGIVVVPFFTVALSSPSEPPAYVTIVASSSMAAYVVLSSKCYMRGLKKRQEAEVKRQYEVSRIWATNGGYIHRRRHRKVGA